MALSVATALCAISHVARESDDEWHSVYSSIVRAHQDAAGATGGRKKKCVGQESGRVEHENSRASRRVRPALV